MACVRARPPLTPFLLSRLIVCPQSRERRELFAEANADYFFAAATKLITGESSRDTTNRRIDSFRFRFHQADSSSSRENLTRAVSPVPTICHIEGERYRRENCLHFFFFESVCDRLESDRYVNTHRLLRHRVRH